MKNKTTKKLKQYVSGGDIGQVMSAAAPMMGMIPGAQPFAPLLGMMGSVLSTQAPTKSNIVSATPGKYAVGGPMDKYDTKLSPAEQIQYNKWRSTLPSRLQGTQDYDLQGFWKENPNFRLDTEDAHLTDKFKKPNHETFSLESQYATGQNLAYAGAWNGDNYVKPMVKYGQKPFTKYADGGQLLNYIYGEQGPQNPVQGVPTQPSRVYNNDQYNFEADETRPYMKVRNSVYYSPGTDELLYRNNINGKYNAEDLRGLENPYKEAGGKLSPEAINNHIRKTYKDPVTPKQQLIDPLSTFKSGYNFNDFSKIVPVRASLGGEISSQSPVAYGQVMQPKRQSNNRNNQGFLLAGLGMLGGVAAGVAAYNSQNKQQQNSLSPATNKAMIASMNAQKDYYAASRMADSTGSNSPWTVNYNPQTAEQVTYAANGGVIERNNQPWFVDNKYDVKRLATGGDVPLSNESFQVKGNPNVTDGNYYPEYNAKLDNNEVVKMQQDGTPFVYSTKLKDPMTNKPFSDLAAKAEKAKGKAEKMIKHNPYDEQAKSTISHSNNTLESLANAQEKLAAYLGHRNPDGSTVQKAAMGGVLKYENGGPTDPIQIQDRIYFDPQNQSFVMREGYTFYPVSKEMNQSFMQKYGDTPQFQQAVALSGTGTMLNTQYSTNSFSFDKYKMNTNSPRVETPNEFDFYANSYKQSPSLPPYKRANQNPGVALTTTNLNTPIVSTTPSKSTALPTANVPAKPKSTTTTNTTTGDPDPFVAAFQTQYNQRVDAINSGSAQSSYANYLKTGNTTPVKPQLTVDGVNGPKTKAARQEYGRYLNTMATGQDRINAGLDSTDPMAALDAGSELGPQPVSGRMTNGAGLAGAAGVTDNTTYFPAGTNMPGAVPPTTPLPNTSDEPYQTPWTGGDYLKGIELLGKTIGAFGPPERERQMTDNTQMTKQVYDPRQAVYQNQRNFQNTVNTTSTPSINLRRGLINSALANTMNANSNVLTQYQQMNQQANSTYEDRLANQRRFNIESMFRTNDMNAQNRAAKDMVQQNMFSSIGQFGEDLNRKRYASDVVNLLGKQYEDVYKGVFKKT
jgi:hypothetical protein